jgi:hypothetical protein
MSMPRNDEQHPAESLPCVLVQRAWNTDRRGRPLPVFGVLLSPTIASAAMSFSSVSVILEVPAQDGGGQYALAFVGDHGAVPVRNTWSRSFFI